MGIYNIFDTVGNKITRRKRVEHSVMAHRYTVVDGYGVELGGKATEFLYFFLDYLTYLMQMHMSGYKLCERIDNGNYRLSYLLFFHAVGTP